MYTERVLTRVQDLILFSFCKNINSAIRLNKLTEQSKEIEKINKTILTKAVEKKRKMKGENIYTTAGPKKNIKPNTSKTRQ